MEFGRLGRMPLMSDDGAAAGRAARYGVIANQAALKDQRFRGRVPPLL